MTEGSAPYHVLRELGRRAQPTLAAMRGDAANVFVIQRFEAAAVTPAALDKLAREAKALFTHWHPNVARVRHVDRGANDLVIATELLDGITLEDLLALSARRGKSSAGEPLISHAILARIFLDVLGGLSALHGLREGVSESLAVFHGELCPANVVVGKDGVARLVAVFRPRPVVVDPKSEGFRFVAPELLARGAAQDARADIHAAGAMLWEALMERPLFKAESIAGLVVEQKEKDPPRPSARLADVVLRALELEPARRYRTAQEMAATMRALAGTIAPGSMVAQTVNDLAGDRIRSRRSELDPSTSIRRRSTAPPPPATPPPSTREEPVPHSAVTQPAFVPARHAPSPPRPTDSQETTVRREALKRPAVPPEEPTQRFLPVPPPSEVTRPALPELPPSDPHPAAAAEVEPTPNEISDFPGPRPSMTEEDYLAELARTSIAEDGRGDAVALEAAREVVVSSRSFAPPERRSAPDSVLPNLSSSSGKVPVLPLPLHAPPSPTPRPSGRPLVVDVMPPTSGAPPATASRPAPRSAPPAPPRSRLPLLLVAIALVAILALGAGAMIIARRGADARSGSSDDRPASPPSTVVVPPPANP